MNLPERSLITAQMRTAIGLEVNFGTPFEVEKGAIKNFAEVINSRDPLYSDEEYAKSRGYRTVIAPPTFSAYDLQREAPIQALELGFEIGSGLHGGDDWEFLQDVEAGDVLTPKGKIIDLFEREGKRGRMLFIVSEVTYTNQRGEVVAIYRLTTIILPR